jgi:hypothetical protein
MSADLDRITNHRMTSDQIDMGIITGEKQRALCGEWFVPEVQVGTSGRADVKGAKMCPKCEDIVSTWRQIKKLQDKLLHDLRVRYVRDPEEQAAMAMMNRARSVQERKVVG